MTWQLKVFNFDKGATRWGDLSDRIRGLTVSASLHGGVETISFELAEDYINAWRWAYDHVGEGIYLFDNCCTTPVAEAVIMEPEISVQGSRIVASGPYQAYCFSQVYNDAATWFTAGTTSEQIADMLSTECPGVNSDQSNIDTTGTNNYPWQPAENGYPGDYIPFLASLSDNINRDWYFWLKSAPLAGTLPDEPLPYFQRRANLPRLFVCSREDMSELRITPSMRKLANSVRSFYTTAAGVQDITAEITDADSISRYGRRERHDFDLGQAPAVAAGQYANLLLAHLKDPQQSASFTLDSWLYDQWGGRWPLWRLIADFPCKFGVRDLIPDSSVLGYTFDSKRVFITLAAEYDYESNRLTVTPDTESHRADAMLARYRGLK